MSKFRVLQITRNTDEYSEYKPDTLEFPDLVEEVDDEVDSFVYEVDTGNYWKVEDFFNMVDISEFTAIISNPIIYGTIEI